MERICWSFFFCLYTLALHAGDTTSMPHSKELSAQCLKTLNRVRTLKARFTQTRQRASHQTQAPSGDKACTPPETVHVTGHLYLKRPSEGDGVYGWLKLEADAPARLKIISAGRTLYVWQGHNGEADRLPVSSTPLSLLLRKSLRLGRFVQEKSITLKDDVVYWTLTAPEEEQGALTLIFSYPDYVLHGWILHDIYGEKTHVKLTEVAINVRLDAHLFKVE